MAEGSKEVEVLREEEDRHPFNKEEESSEEGSWEGSTLGYLAPYWPPAEEAPSSDEESFGARWNARVQQLSRTDRAEEAAPTPIGYRFDEAEEFEAQYHRERAI